MNITKMARQLLEIAQDLRKRSPVGSDFDSGELIDFDQTWASTALGFGGVGGSALTTARTYVFIPYSEYRRRGDKAFVYFDGKYAYSCPINHRFEEDLKNHNMASVMESSRYNNEDN